MKYLSKFWFFWSYLVAELIGYPLMVVPLIASGGIFELEYLPFFLMGYLLSIYSGILFIVLVYKMWKIIPPRLARTTPGKAVGFLFIPFYNFYWVFMAIWGWTEDFNFYMYERKSERLNVSEGLGLTISIFAGVVAPINMVLGFAGQRLIGLVIGFPAVVLLPMFIYQVCSKLNELPDEVTQAPPIPVYQSPPGPGYQASPGPGYQPPPGAIYQPPPGPVYYQQPTGKRGLGVASLVLGILSIVIMYLGVILGVIGIVLAVKQRAIRKEGLSTAGLVTSIIGTAIWGLVLVILLFVLLIEGI